MSRRNARKHAFYLLYQMGFYKEEERKETEEIFFQENEEIDETDKTFIQSEVGGVQEHMEEIDTVISGVARGWTIERMSKVDLAILRLAVYEMKYVPQIPVSVVVNEAVELAKKYSSDEAPAFINGILGKLA